MSRGNTVRHNANNRKPYQTGNPHTEDGRQFYSAFMKGRVKLKDQTWKENAGNRRKYSDTEPNDVQINHGS